MKKMVFFAVCLAVLLAPLTSYAFTYSDGEVSISVPEGDYTYYYTPGDTNFVGPVLAQALSEDGLLVKCGVYDADGRLRYSFNVSQIPVNEAADGQSLRQGRVNLLADQEEEEFQYEQPVEEEVFGKPASVLHGASRENEDYNKDIYVMKEGGSLYVISLFYRTDDEGVALDQAMAQMNTIRFGESALPATTPSRPPGHTTGPAPTETPVPTPQPSPIVIVQTQTAEPDGIPVWAVICIVAGMAAVIVFLLIKHRPRPKEGRHMGSRALFKKKKKALHYKKWKIGSGKEHG